MGRRLVLIMSIFLAGGSWADDECSSRFAGGSESLGSVAQSLPVLDQESYNICYSYTASHLYDFWRRSHGTATTEGFRTSPIEASMGAATGDYRDNFSHSAGRRREGDGEYNMMDLEYGDAERPLQYLIARGGCNMYDLDYLNDVSSANSLVRKLKEAYYNFQEYRESYNGLVDSQYIPGTPAYMARTVIAPLVIQCAQALTLNPTVQLPDASAIVQLLYDENPVRFLHRLVYSECDGDRESIPELHAPRVVSFKWYEGFDRETEEMPPVSTYRNAVDEVLEREGDASQPVGISFCASVFRRTYRHPVRKSDVAGEIANYSCSRHSAAIVGRQMRDGVCKYLVQNHGGTECNGNYNAQGVECEEGRIWVPAESLFNATFGYEHLQERTWGEYLNSDFGQ